MAISQKPSGVTRVRIPAKTTSGWMMRIMRGGQKTLEWFADKKYGGKEKARAAAARRYRELDAKLPHEETAHKNQITKRNTSGKVGVHAKESFGRKENKRPYCSYNAFWTTKSGDKAQVSFAWLKFGDSLAWKMACYARDNEVKDRATVLRKFRFKDN
jgi:hypothetical protein